MSSKSSVLPNNYLKLLDEKSKDYYNIKIIEIRRLFWSWLTSALRKRHILIIEKCQVWLKLSLGLWKRIWRRNPWATSLTWETVPINKCFCDDYAITLREKNHNLRFEIELIGWLFIKKLYSPSHKDTLHQVWLKLVQWSRRYTLPLTP